MTHSYYRLAYGAGVTTAVTAPVPSGFLAGLGTAFSVAASHKLEQGALVQSITAVHVGVYHGGPLSVSSQITTLRRLLAGGGAGEVGMWFQSISKGTTTLVIDVEEADIIASIISVKTEIEESTGVKLKITLSGASEAHILARELAQADVGVIVKPSRPYPSSWGQRRLMRGPPLTPETAIAFLMRQNVTVGLGVDELWSCRNTRFDAAWAAIDAMGAISREQAYAIVTTNLEKLLGVDVSSEDLVATRAGGLLDFTSEVVAVISPVRGSVDLF